MFPREEKYPGILMELKWKKGLDLNALDKLAEDALIQIEKMRYDSALKESAKNQILKFGIAFSGKKVSVQTEL